MTIEKNLPLIMDLTYRGYNLALPCSDGSRGEFQPVYRADGTFIQSYCNQFVRFVMNGLGIMTMAGYSADGMVTTMAMPSSGFMVVVASVAQEHANNGALVIAGSQSSTMGGHGHVCIVLPGVLELSQRLMVMVPKVANVGKDVFFGRKLSFAFGPDSHYCFFVYKEMVS